MRLLGMLWLGCAGVEVPDTGGDTGSAPVTGYEVYFETDPSPAVAGQEAEFTIFVRDQLDRPIEDLQTAHERVVHTLLVSSDLTSFQHLHQEDFEPLSADSLRSSTFHFPVTFPLAGDYRLVFDFAHQNEYLTDTDWITVTGSPSVATEPVLEYVTERTVDGLIVLLRWDVEPYAGYEAVWTVTVCDPAGEPDPKFPACQAYGAGYGADVTDLVQWLGADGHAAMVSSDLGWSSHTHAWFPDMENVAPGHDMPHLYWGPELPFHYVFPNAGAHKLWVQFARESAPDDPIVADFSFDVAP